MLGIFVMLQLNASLVEMIPTAMQDVRNSTLFVTGTQLFKIVAVVVAALIFRSVRSIVLACMLAAALSVAILLRYLYQRFGPFWKHFDRKFFIEQLAYAVPLGAYGIVWVFRKDLDNYFVSAMYSPAQYAIYAIGWLEVPLISALPGIDAVGDGGAHQRAAPGGPDRGHPQRAGQRHQSAGDGAVPHLRDAAGRRTRPDRLLLYQGVRRQRSHLLHHHYPHRAERVHVRPHRSRLS